MNGDPPVAVAHRIGVPPEEWVLFLDGSTPLTPRLAAKLETAGWSNAEFWLRLQEAYDQAQQRQPLETQSATTLPASIPSGPSGS